MQKVSMRTLALLLELLLAVVSHRCLSVARAEGADAVWLANDCTAVEQGQCVGTGCTVN
jgi:hypothetical protein